MSLSGIRAARRCPSLKISPFFPACKWTAIRSSPFPHFHTRRAKTPSLPSHGSTDKGDHILRYTVTADGVPYVKDVTVHVCDFTMYVSGAASCVAEGIGTFQCEHGKTAEKTLPVNPDAHTYWAKWTWDGETPSVEFYCKDCDAEAECTEEIKVVESEEESVDATCQTEGKKVLEASVVFGGYRYIDLSSCADCSRGKAVDLHGRGYQSLLYLLGLRQDLP